jgi:hypothetical protein
VAAGGDATPGGRAGSPAGVRGSPPPATRGAGAAAHAAHGGGGGAMPTPRRGHAVELLAEQPLSARWRSFKTRTLSTLALLGGFVAILYAGHVVVCVFIMCIQARACVRPHACQRARMHAPCAARARALWARAPCAPRCSMAQLRGGGAQCGRATAPRAQPCRTHARGTCGACNRLPRGGLSRPRACRALTPPAPTLSPRTRPPRPQIAMVAELFTLAAQKNIEKGLPGFRLQQWYFFACAAFFAYGRLLKSNLLVEVSENAAWLPGIISARPRARRRGACVRTCACNPMGARMRRA